jgi:hypothetical protein
MTIPATHRVQHKETQRWGVTVPDMQGMLCDLPGTVVVAWDGEEGANGDVDPRELVDHGPEKALPDIKRCGAGRGAECCAFLTLTGAREECQRHTSLRWAILFRVKDMNAKRTPTEPYPACMKFPKE